MFWTFSKNYNAQDVLCAAAFRVHGPGGVAVVDFGGLDCSHYSNKYHFSLTQIEMILYHIAY